MSIFAWEALLSRKLVLIFKIAQSVNGLQKDGSELFFNQDRFETATPEFKFDKIKDGAAYDRFVPRILVKVGEPRLQQRLKTESLCKPKLSSHSTPPMSQGNPNSPVIQAPFTLPKSKQICCTLNSRILNASLASIHYTCVEFHGVSHETLKTIPFYGPQRLRK